MKKNILVLATFTTTLVLTIFTLSIISLRTQTRSDAAKSTTLSFSKLAGPVSTGQDFSVNVSLNPGQNKVSFINLLITYDNTILEPGNDGIVPAALPNTNPPASWVVLDGPTSQCNGSQCTMSIALSIGSSFATPITAPITLATVHFIPIDATGTGSTTIGFGTNTQVLSVAAGDAGNENVLLSTTPTTVVTVGDEITPMPTNEPTPLPTITDAPTFAPIQTGDTTGNLVVRFEGINANNNSKPKSTQTPITLSFYKSTNSDFSTPPDATATDFVTLTGGNTTGDFTNQVFNLSKISPGSYYILAQSPEGSLREVLNNSQAITIASKQNNQLTTTPLIMRMGDFDNNDVIDITDYNILTDCFGSKVNSDSCTAHHISNNIKKNFADINDDGAVDLIDYNLLIRHFNEKGY